MTQIQPFERRFSSFSALHEAYLQLHQERDVGANGVVRAKNWLFRGHTDSKWPLATAFDRLTSRFGISAEDRADVETQMIRQYQRQAPMYFADNEMVPAEDHRFQWLSLMQHYGAPTRLLDWSYSFYVALYFAVRDFSPHGSAQSKPSFAIWVLNMGFLDNLAMNELWPKALRELRDQDKGRRTSKLMNAQLGLDKEVPIENPFVVCMSPFHSNRRLTVQQGTFVTPSPVTETMEGGISKVLAHTSAEHAKGAYQKWTCDFDAPAFFTTFELLMRMNLTDESLFGGLDAWTRSLVQRCARPGFYRQVEGTRGEEQWNARQ